MNTKLVIKKLQSVMHNGPDREIAAHAARGHVAAGLSAEGYSGGYRDALSDVILLLNGIYPNRNNWWESYNPGGD